MCVFRLNCFLAKNGKAYKGESSKMYEVEMFLGIGFNCSMENRVSVFAASLVGKERNKETKWSYGRVEKIFFQLNACAKSVVFFRPFWTCERVMFAV